MVFNTVLAESAAGYAIIQEAKKIKSVQDANDWYKKIKNGEDDKNALKWIKFVLKSALPAALMTPAVVVAAPLSAGLSIGFALYGGLLTALSAWANGAPGSVNDKYNELSKLQAEVNAAIGRIESSKDIDPAQKKKAIADLRKFRDKLDAEVKKYATRVNELGPRGMYKKESADYYW